MDEVDDCIGCAATLTMLKTSEVPIRELGAERFGERYPPTGNYPRPDTSVCVAKKMWD